MEDLELATGVGSDDADLQDFLSLLGPEMDGLFEAGLGDAEQQQHSTPSSVATGTEPTASHDSSTPMQSPGSGHELSAHMQQLEALQQQLSVLQGMVGARLQQQQQQQQQQQPAAPQMIDYIRETLVHLQGLLATTQKQQQGATAMPMHTAGQQPSMHAATSQLGMQQAGGAWGPSGATAVPYMAPPAHDQQAPRLMHQALIDMQGLSVTQVQQAPQPLPLQQHYQQAQEAQQAEQHQAWQQHQQLLDHHSMPATQVAAHQPDIYALFSSSDGSAAPAPAPSAAASVPAPPPPPPTTGQRGRRAGGQAGKGTQRPRRNHVAELTAQLEAKQAEAEALAQANLDLKRRQRVLDKVVQARQGQLRRLKQPKVRPQEEAERGDAWYQQPDQSAVASLFSAEELQSIDLAKPTKIYLATLNEISRLVGLAPLAASDPSGPLSDHRAASASGGGVDPSTLARIETLMNATRELSRAARDAYPSYECLFGSSDASVAAPPEGLWQRALAALALREDQAADLLVLRDVRMALTRQVYQERLQLALQLQEAMAGSELITASSAAATEQQQSTASHADASGGKLTWTEHRCKTREAMDGLQRNMLKERCVMLLTEEVFYDALDALQIARMCLACYPLKPDEVAICNEIAKQQQWQQQQ